MIDWGEKVQEYIPHRKCVGCMSIKSKKELLRIVKTNEGIFIDPKQKMQGRGAYICKDLECLKLAIKKKGLEKSLKINIPKSFYEELERFLKDGQ